MCRSSAARSSSRDSTAYWAWSPSAGRVGLRSSPVSRESGRRASRCASPPSRVARATVLLGRCSEEPLTAYGPFAEIARPLRRRARHQRGRRARRRQRLRARSAARPCRGAMAPDPGVRARVFGAFDALVCALAQPVAADRRRPAVGRPGHAARTAQPASLAKARPAPRHRDRPPGGRSAPGDDLRSALSDMRRDGAVEDIVLGGLAHDDVSALARAWLGDDADPALAAAVLDRSGGNALFAQELLRDDAARRGHPRERARRDRRPLHATRRGGSCAAGRRCRDRRADRPRRARGGGRTRPPRHRGRARRARRRSDARADRHRPARGRVPARARARRGVRRRRPAPPGAPASRRRRGAAVTRRRPARGVDRLPPHALGRSGGGGPLPRARSRQRDDDGRVRAGCPLPRASRRGARRGAC